MHSSATAARVAPRADGARLRPWRLLPRLGLTGALLGCFSGSHPAAAQEPARREDRAHVARGDTTDLGSLAREVSRLEEAYRGLGRVERWRPRLAQKSTRLALPLQVGADQTGCTTVAILGSRNLSFVLQFPSPEGEETADRAWPVSSSVGVAEVTRCGERQAALERLTLSLRSPRGLVEILVLRSTTPPPPVSALLPGRDPGPSLPTPEIGPRPLGGSVAARVAKLEEENVFRGARAQRKTSALVDERGRSSSTVTLAPGCHQLDLLAPPHREGTPDLDAVLTSIDRGEELALDENESPQARLRYCVGRSERARLSIGGALPNSEVTLLHSEWDLPSGLPLDWGPLARASMARVLWTDLPPRVPEAPVLATLGVQGTTELGWPARPGACYLVAVARVRGEARRLALDAQAGLSHSSITAPAGHDGTSLGICAQGEPWVRLRVYGMGASFAWLASVWEHPSEVRP